MFILEKVLEVHHQVLKKYGGASGIRDSNLLNPALHRPFQTFGGEDLYPAVYEKAAAVMQSIIINRPFIDGNKRTGFVLGVALLLDHQIRLTATEDNRYDFVIKVSTGDLSFENIIRWLQQNTQPISL